MNAVTCHSELVELENNTVDEGKRKANRAIATLKWQVEYASEKDIYASIPEKGKLILFFKETSFNLVCLIEEPKFEDEACDIATHFIAQYQKESATISKKRIVSYSGKHLKLNANGQNNYDRPQPRVKDYSEPSTLNKALNFAVKSYVAGLKIRLIMGVIGIVIFLIFFAMICSNFGSR